MKNRVEIVVLVLLLLLSVCIVMWVLSDSVVWLRAPQVVEVVELAVIGKGGDCCYSIVWNQDEWQAFAEQAGAKEEFSSRFGDVRDAIVVVARGMELVAIHTPESERRGFAFKGVASSSLPHILEFRRNGNHTVKAYVVEDGDSKLYYASTTPGIAKAVPEDVAVPFEHWRSK